MFPQIAIDVLNSLGRSDGKRGHWKTAKATARYFESEIHLTMETEKCVVLFA